MPHYHEPHTHRETLMNPIVIAYHLVWVAYGWWLPNDPRGSMSRAIRNDVLADLGQLHHGRKRVQPASRDIRAFYHNAASRLEHELVEFGEDERACIAAAFAGAIDQFKYTCYACAIMPDHVHLVVRKHRHLAEEMIANLQIVFAGAAARGAVSRLRPSGVGRAGLEGVSGSPGRHPAHDRIRRRQPGQDRSARSDAPIRQVVRRVAASPGARSAFAVRATGARAVIAVLAKPQAAVPRSRRSRLCARGARHTSNEIPCASGRSFE